MHEALLETLGPKLYDAHIEQRELEQQVTQTLQAVLQRDETPMTTADRVRVAQEVADDILGHGPLEPYLRDPDVSEIMVNGHDQIYVERDGLLYPVEAAFADESHLRRTIDKIVARVGRRVDESSPMVDARLPDGSRVNAVVPPVALDGSLLTIRKFAVEPLTVGHLIHFGTMTPQVADLLRVCVEGRLNIVIGGGTGSGKTTTLNVLSAFVPEDERIVTIEDAAELQLRQEHVLRLESRPPNLEKRGEITIRDLVRNALRMRPDRIIIGEVRDEATLDMLQAMNTGHDGSITTIHSNSPRDSLSRMETMVMMANVELTQRAIRDQMASAIDLILHQARLKDGSRRITHITEVHGMEGEVVMLQDLFLFDFHAGTDERGRHRGTLRSTGLRPLFLNRLADRGIHVPPGIFRGVRTMTRLAVRRVTVPHRKGQGRGTGTPLITRACAVLACAGILLALPAGAASTASALAAGPAPHGDDPARQQQFAGLAGHRARGGAGVRTRAPAGRARRADHSSPASGSWCCARPPTAHGWRRPCPPRRPPGGASTTRRDSTAALARRDLGRAWSAHGRKQASRCLRRREPGRPRPRRDHPHRCHHAEHGQRRQRRHAETARGQQRWSPGRSRGRSRACCGPRSRRRRGLRPPAARTHRPQAKTHEPPSVPRPPGRGR